MFLRKTGVAGALALVFGGGLPMAQTFAQNDPTVRGALEPVVITASRFPEPLAGASSAISVITRDEIEQSGFSNIVEFLDTVPGLSVSRLYGRLGIDSEVDIGFMGGNASRNVLVLIDGQRLNNVNNENVRFSQIPISSVDRIEVRKAGGGVLFGDRAIGGVINIITRANTEPEVRLSLGSFDYRKLEFNLGASTPSGPLQISGMSASQSGYRDRSEQRQDTIRINTSWANSISQLNLSLRLFNEKNQLPGTITKSQFLVNPRQAQSQNADAQKSGETVTFAYLRGLSADANLEISAQAESSKNNSNTIFETQDKRKTNKSSAQMLLLLGGPDQHNAIAGVDILDAENKVQAGPRVGQNGYSVFLTGERFLLPDFSINAGVREQYVISEFRESWGANQQTARDKLSASHVGFAYRWMTNQQSLVGYSKSFRFPTTEEFYYFDNTFTPSVINSGVRPMLAAETYLVHRLRLQRGLIELNLREIKTRDEIDFDFGCSKNPNPRNESCNSNLYDTRRRVISVNGSGQLMRDLRGSVSVDFIAAENLSATGASNTLPMAPHRRVRAALDFDLHQGVKLIGRIDHRSDMYPSGDTGNTSPKIPGRTLGDAGMVKQTKSGLSYSFWVRNITNKKYYDFAFAGANPAVYPADPRSFEINLNYIF